MTGPRIKTISLADAMARQREAGSEPPAGPPAVADSGARSNHTPGAEAEMAIADGGPDDLPRTFRRERDAQREQRDREQRERAAAEAALAPRLPDPAYGLEPGIDSFDHQPFTGPHDPGVVTAIKVPFFSLMLFFIKAVLAAIPALILLGAMLWGVGQFLKTYFPSILKMTILISFPN